MKNKKLKQSKKRTCGMINQLNWKNNLMNSKKETSVIYQKRKKLREAGKTIRKRRSQ
jgi:hypothetical protein